MIDKDTKDLWDEQDQIYNDGKAREEAIKEHINQMTSLFQLNHVYKMWEDRMKELAAQVLKPGADEIIEEITGGLSALDYIWKLHGDYSYSGNQTEPFRPNALDYYVGRKCYHVWGTGILVKMRDGYGIRVRLPCGTEGCKGRITVYARPGCHNGAFCYVYSKEGEYLADLRNQWFKCTKCKSRKRRKL